jgi:N-acetylneuraminic acid mutarotase
MQILLFLLFLLLAGCGGGGGGGAAGGPAPTPTGTAPQITNLTFYPEFVFVGEGGGQTDVFGTVDFTDPDGNVTQFVLDVFDSTGQLVANLTESISASGITSGTLQGGITITTDIVGFYTISVHLVDGTSRSSNSLTGEFRISEFPYVDKATMPEPRLDFSVAALDGQIYLIGGRDALAPIIPRPQVANVDRYDPITDTWTTVAPLPLAVAEPMVAAVDGKLYAMGGEPDNLMAGDFVHEYDPATNTWTTRNIMPVGCWSAAVAVQDDRIFIAGGSGAGMTFDALVIYRPADNSWAGGAPMTDARTGTGGTAIGGRVLVYGGYGFLHTSDGGYLRSMESYDPVMDMWSAIADGEPRADFGIAAVDDILYTFGGNNVARSLDWVRAYDPAIDEWRGKVSLPVASGYVKAVSVGEKIYLFTTDNTYEYTPANDPS